MKHEGLIFLLLTVLFVGSFGVLWGNQAAVDKPLAEKQIETIRETHYIYIERRIQDGQ